MKLSAILLIAALVGAGSVRAQTPEEATPPSPEVQTARRAMLQACATDISSHCAGKQRHELMMCLHSNADNLSAGCKDAMSKLPRPARTGTPGGPATAASPPPPAQ
jgi:hypothetical protein